MFGKALGGLTVQVSIRTCYVLFFFKFTSFFSTKCLFTTDLPRWQWMATTITISRMNTGSRCRCSWFWYVNFFCLFFTPLNNYLQSDYMYGMATRMTTVNDHPVKDDEWGTRDEDDASQVPGIFFFLSFSLFYWLTFKIWLHHEDKHTPPPPPQWTGLKMQMCLMPQVYSFSFDTMR